MGCRRNGRTERGQGLRPSSEAWAVLLSRPFNTSEYKKSKDVEKRKGKGVDHADDGQRRRGRRSLEEKTESVC
jgi:hypothetical protein